MATRSELAPHALKKIAKELQSLERSPPEDIQVLNNEQDLTEIQAWIRGPDGTPYENGYFKVRLLLNEGYPDTPPKGYFTTKIFHPNVASSGEICVNTLKKDWKAELGIAHVLLTIKCLLIVPNPESALNEEAGKLLLEQYDDYAKRAKLYTTIHAKHGKSEFQKLFAERDLSPSPPAAPQSSSSSASPKEGEKNGDKEQSNNNNNNTASTTITTATSKTSTVPATAPQNENPSVTTSGSSAAIASGKQKEEATTTMSMTASATPNAAAGGNVLTPSAVSNNIPAQTSSKKRPAGEVQQDGKDDMEAPSSKQPRVETLPKKKPATTADRKKRLRRL